MRLRVSMWRRRGGERGSALMLVPAGFLVLMLLGGMAVDSGAAYLGQRQLADVLAGAANDAAGAAIADQSFYDQGRIAVDPTAAAGVVCRSVAAADDADLHQLHLQLAVAGASISVRGDAVVAGVFGRFVPGFARHRVSAQASAVAAQAPADRGSQPQVYWPVVCT